MLFRLTIENVAVIERADVEFDRGFNVLTGETGAGKSIVIDSINLVLGQRSNREIIRTGADKACVSAVFCLLPESLLAPLAALGAAPDEDGNLILEREITRDGRGSARIGGRPVPVATLREAGNLLINIHGQHDNQSLLQPQQHLGILDRFAETDVLLEAYTRAYDEWRAVTQRLRALQTDEQEKERRIDLLRYQIEEIDAAELTPGEEEELLARRKKLQNLEKIVQAAGGAYAALRGEEAAGAVELAQAAAGALQEIAGVSEELAPEAERLFDLSYQMEECASRLREFLDGMEDEPENLDEIESRIDRIYRLKKKYGANIEEILAYRDEAEQELSEFVNRDELLDRLTRQAEEARREAEEYAACLHDKREQAAAQLTAAVERELQFLDMPSARFLTALTPAADLTPRGADEAEFLLSANPGEAPRPLAKIASGGELSRIMLAIKNALAGRDEVPTMVFDEIDAGVSGRAAQKIGVKLHEIARQHQILCVTHLAQIAAYGDRHMLISKAVRDGRTFTQIRPLDHAGRCEELARIIGGDLITPSTLQSAGELLAHAHGGEK